MALSDVDPDGFVDKKHFRAGSSTGEDQLLLVPP